MENSSNQQQNLAESDIERDPSNVEAIFIEKILANPKDREWRQLFFAWLEKNNDPRGEFMRIKDQILLKNRMPKKEFWERIKRMHELGTAVDEAWELNKYAEAWPQNREQIPSILYNEIGLPKYIRLKKCSDVQTQIKLMRFVAKKYPSIHSINFNWSKSVNSPAPSLAQPSQLRLVLDALGDTRIMYLQGCENLEYNNEDLKHPYMGRTVGLMGRGHRDSMSAEIWQQIHGVFNSDAKKAGLGAKPASDSEGH